MGSQTTDREKMTQTSVNTFDIGAEAEKFFDDS